MIQPKLGLVTVLFNCPDVLPDFFRCLVRQTYTNYILYVIDNSTNDDSYSMCKELSEKYQLSNIVFIKNDNNMGVAAANNQGISAAIHAGCDYVLLLNNDIEFDNQCLLEELVQESLNKNEPVIVPKITYFDSGKLWYAGGDINQWKGTTIHFGDRENDSDVFNQIVYTKYAPTCFMLIRKDVFENVGMMDEDYFVYYDDTDFVFRLNTMKYKILYFPKISIIHKVSSSTGGDTSPFSVYYGNRNRIYFILKNLSGIRLISALVFTLSTRVIKCFLYNKTLRKKMLSGLYDGIKLSISNV
ncbi:glycosyltransferase family 2 protein [uncultured Tolumonas sp.]|uniref:glycosyltransferase family 2 protein n=1 Tax=uncultured Tolumonas sp. TaxID=263765 RepID=UPI002A0A620C|nr:glycosyltransferase family 2 protein [uncultured Tolumonas sp.]